jgi:hypothetical protein
MVVLPVARKSDARIFRLPTELIDHIFTYLSPTELETASLVCKTFRNYAANDILWQSHVQSNVPGTTLTDPRPYSTFRELYVSLDPHWFLPKYKIWFSDHTFTGKLIVVRYHPWEGLIEGLALVAERSKPTLEHWEHNDEVLIHSFNPKVRLHSDQPTIHLHARSYEQFGSDWRIHDNSKRFNTEIPMRIPTRNRSGFYSNFLLSSLAAERTPTSQYWPPPAVPASQRVPLTTQEHFATHEHEPHSRAEMSDQTFRVRQWFEMLSHPNGHGTGTHLGEEIWTFSTLDPHLYTPTANKPYRGIWVGDYSGHGCEFLLLHQPDDPEPSYTPEITKLDDESEHDFERRKWDLKVHRGRLEAIKLTGDPNIPRGEYTFIADDLGKGGFVRRATEERFKGARIVRSRGHIAARMFRGGMYLLEGSIFQKVKLLARILIRGQIDISTLNSFSSHPTA